MNDPRFEVFPFKRHVEGTWSTDPIRGRIELPAYDELTGEFGWRFRDANGRITLTGGEGFTRRENAHRALEGACLDLLAATGVISAGEGYDLSSLPIVDLDE